MILGWYLPIKSFESVEQLCKMGTEGECEAAEQLMSNTERSPFVVLWHGIRTMIMRMMM